MYFKLAENKEVDGLKSEIQKRIYVVRYFDNR